MATLTIEALLSAKISEEVFLGDNTVPALVLQPFRGRGSGGVDTPSEPFRTDRSEADTSGFPLGGQTGTEVMGPLDAAKHLMGMSSLIDPKSEIRWLRKSTRNPFGSLITIGRARNNDVVIDHPTISKVHAIFTNPSGAWMIEDDSSANGTFLNGAPLTPKEKLAISDGDRVRFGPTLVGRFFLPESLWQYVQLANAT